MYQDMRDGGEMRAVPLRTIKEMCEELQQLGVEMEWDGEINCPEALKRYGVFSIVKSALITYGALPGMLTPSTVDGRKTYVESALDQMPVGQELPTLSGAQLELLVAAHCLTALVPLEFRHDVAERRRLPWWPFQQLSELTPFQQYTQVRRRPFATPAAPPFSSSGTYHTRLSKVNTRLSKVNTRLMAVFRRRR